MRTTFVQGADLSFHAEIRAISLPADGDALTVTSQRPISRSLHEEQAQGEGA
ncbi:MAG: hypothetical protein RJA34_2473 [Pseudomonadota bacterium]